MVFVCKSDFNRLPLPSLSLYFSKLTVLNVFLYMKMEKVAKVYNVSFVVNTSELGEDDPLMQNVRSFCFFPPIQNGGYYASFHPELHWSSLFIP